ncbi:uncharacterized protein [Onthophagus taurus]|uniref:uncharacterized protein isoform X1 n=2 Tax=Onthophagus taurus TaxID=166361 RepID=UPI0039BDF6A6
MVMRKKQQKPRNTRPKIDYPPLTTKKWIPPDKRKKKKREPAYKKPSTINVKLERSSLKKVWHGFEYIESKKIYLMVGHWSQFYKKYGFKTCGFQGAANCIVACAFAQMFDIIKWTPYTLDKILDVGDKLHEDSIILLGLERNKTHLRLDEVYHTYFVDRFRITMSTKGKMICSRMLPDPLEPGIHFIDLATEFMKDNNFTVVQLQPNRFFAVWLIGNGYFVFDPCEHDQLADQSLVPIGRGFCVLIRAKNLETIRNFILDSVKSSEINPNFRMTATDISRKFEINTAFPECLDDANLELRALSDADKQKIEELQIEKMKAKGAALLLPPPPDPNDRMIEIDEEPPPAEEEEDEADDGQAAKPVAIGEGEEMGEEEEPPEKLVMVHVKPPIEKAHAASLTYFRELIPELAGILRGTMHQADPKFMKCAGKQSITMAVSAVSMLRIFSSKYWTSTVLDEILRNGNQMYRESMKTFPGEPVLKITTLCETIKIEEKVFAPKIALFRAVGKLGSDSEEILDLLRALKELFLEEDVCIVLGPLTLAIWRTKGHYYMFDPNERDARGLTIIRTMQVGSKIEILQVDAGAACLTWFTNLKDLVDLYMRNVDRERRREQFVLCKIQVDDYVKLPDKYYGYKPLSLTKWIVRGTFSQNNKKFDDNIRNTQATAICAYAIAMQKEKHVKLWTSEDLDKCLEVGSAYYQETIDTLTAKNKFISRLLMIDELNLKFNNDKKEYVFEYTTCLINGCLFNDDGNEVSNLKKGVIDFFEEGCCGIVSTRGLAVTIFCLEGYYYYFDPHTRNDQGLPCFYGTSMIIRTTSSIELCDLILANLPADTNDMFNITKVDVQILQGEGTPSPPLNHYIGLDANRAILRSRYSEIDPRYGLNAGKQSVCMSFYAIAMSYVIPTVLWSVDILNEVLELGDALYFETMEKNIGDELKAIEPAENDASAPQQPAVEIKIEEPKSEGKKKGKKGKEEDSPKVATPPPEVASKTEEPPEDDANKITTDNVIKNFKIGVNKFDVDYKDVKEGTYADLEATLKEIFCPPTDDNPAKTHSILKPPAPTEGEPPPPAEDEEDRKIHLIESKHMTCVFWTEDDLFYCFDSKPRDENGQIYGKYEWPKKKPHQHHRRGGWKKSMTSDVGNVTSDTAATISEPKNDADVDADEGQEYGLELYMGEEYVEEEEVFSEELERHSSHYWHEKEKRGKGYVMRFIYPEDLVKQITGNTPPLETELPYKLTTLHYLNVVDSKDVFEDEYGTISNFKNVGQWNQFLEFDKNKWILRGTITEDCEIFPEINRGKQTTALCILALSFQTLYTLPIFKIQTVDDIAVYGDRLHTFSLNVVTKIRREEKDGNYPDDELLTIVLHDMTNKLNLAKEFCISGDMIQYTLELSTISGDIKAEDQEDLLDVNRGLNKFFSTQRTGLLESKELLVAIWRQGTAYYMYDSHSRGPSGRKIINGVSCITRFLNLEDLGNLFLENLSSEGDNRFFIHTVELNAMKCPRDEVRKVPVKVQAPKIATPFEEISPGKSIVRGGISQQDPVFKRQANSQCAAVAFVALAMTLVHNPAFWTKPIIDEIVRIGDALYGVALDNLGYSFNPWEQALTVEFVPKDFKIGELKASCEIRENEQIGVVDALHTKVQNLRVGIEKFFQENTHGVITTPPLSVAIWEEEEPHRMIYMFDPNPRGISGMPMMAEEDRDTFCRGTACVVTFDDYKMVADHFSALISPNTDVEFRITPIEICVGKMKTKGKKKKKDKEEVPLAILGRGYGKEFSKACEKKKIQEMIKQLREQEKLKRIAKSGRKSFYMLPGNEMGLIRGSRSQNSKFYCLLSRGNQDIPNCLSAYVMERLLPFNNWTDEVINMTLDIGDQLYKDSFVVYHPMSKKLNLDCVIREIVIKDVRVSLAIGKPVLFNQFTPICVEKALEMFFRQKMFCMLRMNCDVIALFCKDDIYYMFDPHDLTLEVKRVEDRGEAMLVKFNSLRKMSEVIVDNYKVPEDEEMIFSLILVTIKAMQKMPRRKPKELCD